jgi:hypothetical protein
MLSRSGRSARAFAKHRAGDGQRRPDDQAARAGHEVRSGPTKTRHPRPWGPGCFRANGSSAPAYPPAPSRRYPTLSWLTLLPAGRA